MTGAGGDDRDALDAAAAASPGSDAPSPGLASTVPGDVVVGAATVGTEPAPAMGERPDADRLARAVARAKISGALFATEERVKLGRYHLLERIGAGGMGVVWAAWDPELDRRVAIKLVKATLAAARDRILLEGQALAKLSHPNVVPVFDVGVVEQQVYLVMEFVRGKNLRAYAREPRTVRELVGIYRQAALGLAAAHRAGLIHRDFKPDNAILGDDGRVRVLDFGLARGEVPAGSAPLDAGPELTRGAGTPRYMPPEQAAGEALTPAVDQYAFCVSLREALVGRAGGGKDADVPGWLDAIVTRGTAPEVGGRFASMDELLRALARDPPTVWRRRAVVTGALGLAAGAFAVGTLRGGAEPARCVGAAAELARAWNPQARAAVIDHLTPLGAYPRDEATRLAAALDDYGQRWATAHRGACLARDRGELTPQIYERSLGCLARAHAALETVVGVLATVTAERVPTAAIAAANLPQVERCASDAAASVVEPPPAASRAQVDAIAERVERTRVLALAVAPDSERLAADVAAAAQATGYQPLAARAFVVEGIARLGFGNDATAVLQRAVTAALESGDYALAVEAYARAIYAGAQQGKVDLSALPVVEALGRGLPAGNTFARALLANNVGSAELSRGDRRAAGAAFQRAMAESGSLRKLDTELAGIPLNLALTLDEPGARAAALAEGTADTEALLGPHHPDVLYARALGGLFDREPASALRALVPACELYVTYHPTVAELEICWVEALWLALDIHDDAVAQRAGKVLVERATGAAALVTDLAAADAPAAERLEARARAAAAGAEVPWWTKVDAADGYRAAGLVWARRGQPARAVRALRAALALALDAPDEVRFARRRAGIRAELATVLAASDPAGAAALARDALAWYGGLAGYRERVATLAALAR